MSRNIKSLYHYDWDGRLLNKHQLLFWGVKIFLMSDGKQCKLSDIAVPAKRQTPKQLAIDNQQYRLYLQYEYIGSAEQGRKLLEKDIELLKKRLPIGYTVESESSIGAGERMTTVGTY